jgi:hypothetical protein
VKIACIVEGHGEVEAVPVMLRRIAAEQGRVYPEVLRPMRVPASKLVKEGELERAVEFAARKCGPDGGILVLLDCDDGCPAELGPELLARAAPIRPEQPIAVVLAKREYEAWLIAAASSIAGHRGLPANLVPPPDPESIRDAKGWLAERMEAGNYSPTTDQTALTTVFDMGAARAADSFDKLWREIMRILPPHAGISASPTPSPTADHG